MKNIYVFVENESPDKGDSQKTLGMWKRKEGFFTQEEESLCARGMAQPSSQWEYMRCANLYNLAFSVDNNMSL